MLVILSLNTILVPRFKKKKKKTTTKQKRDILEKFQENKTIESLSSKKLPQVKSDSSHPD
jgi:hypothetical protein